MTDTIDDSDYQMRMNIRLKMRHPNKLAIFIRLMMIVTRPQPVYDPFRRLKYVDKIMRAVGKSNRTKTSIMYMIELIVHDIKRVMQGSVYGTYKVHAVCEKHGIRLW